jgi:hypothetical protein
MREASERVHRKAEVMTLRKIALSSGLISTGIVVGLWIDRQPTAKVDLGAAPSQYIPAGTLKLIDAAGVEVATVIIDPTSPLDIPLHIDLQNGPDSELGSYGAFDNGSAILTLNGQPKQGQRSGRYLIVDDTFGRNLTVRSMLPPQTQDVYVPIKPTYKPSILSREWWFGLLLSSNRWRATLQTEVTSEDARLVSRDGKLFAVCGRDKAGTATLLFVDSDNSPQAELEFNALEGTLSSPSFGIFNRSGLPVALLETDSATGPRLSVASADPLSITGSSLFTLDPTGTKLGGDIVRPAPQDGVVDWLAQPMYRVRIPVHLVDGTGKIIWSTDRSAK